MYFDSRDEKLYLSVLEAVRMAYRCARVSVSEPWEEGEMRIEHAFSVRGARPAEPTRGDAVLFSRLFSLGDIKTELSAYAVPGYEGETLRSLTFRVHTAASPDAMPEEDLRFLRGYAFTVLSLTGEEGNAELIFEIVSVPFDKTRILRERPERAAVRRFFGRVTEALRADAEREIERVVLRLPTFLSVPFPYGEARGGQKAMISAVYAAAKHAQTLFAVAPTGTGKTMATLFPAVRALGKRYAEKVFYLTPKNTSALAALEGCEHLRAHGAKLRAIHIGAKERLCRGRRIKGTCYGCEKRRGMKKREAEAIAALLSADKAAITEEDIISAAQTYDICPHELALDYSLYADVIVGDYNYLFDNGAYLRRYFETGGEYFFLIDEAHNLPDRAREMYSGELTHETLKTLLSLLSFSPRLSEMVRKLEAVYLKTVDGLLKDELRTDENGTPVGFCSVGRLPSALLAALSKSTELLLHEVRPRGKSEDAATKLLRETVYELAFLLKKLDAYDEHFITYAKREGESRLLRFYCIDPSPLISARLDKGKGAVFFSATLSPIEYYRSVLCGGRNTLKLEVPSPFDVGAVCTAVVEHVSVRASAREETLSELVKTVIAAMRPRRGNYLVFCPSFAYLERVAETFSKLSPKTPIVVQKRHMSTEEREKFLDSFKADREGYFVGFAVTGGIYSESVDLVGKRLIGTVIIGMGLPQVSAEREVISSYYRDIAEAGPEYAYLYPALNRIMQAAGRVIRSEEDRGVIVLIDDRFRDPVCKKIFPPTWKHLKYVNDRAALTAHIAKFWEGVDKETE